MNEERFSPECGAIAPELNAYVDGELPPAECAGVERHLNECAMCRAEIELLRLVTGSLRQVARPEPSEAMRQRLLAQVVAEQPLRRLEIVSTERCGDQLFRRQEVWWSRESVPSPPRGSVDRPRVRPLIQRCRQQFSTRANGYQVIESLQWKE